MRREILVAGADHIVAVPGLHVDQPMWAVMHAIEEDFGAGAMGDFRNRSDIDDRADRMRRHRAGDEPRAVADQRLQIVDMEIAVLAHAPPDEFRASASSATHVAMLASWSMSVTMISSRVLSREIIWPMPRLTRRMKEVAFMPKQISAVSRALMSSATLSRASATDCRP